MPHSFARNFLATAPAATRIAVSRAEAVAVVVASPKLLDENPSGPKHVKALNPFAALMERAEVHE